MIKLSTLIRWLDAEGHFVAGTHIYDLIKQASVEKFRYRIEQAAQGRETPFAEWFGEEERVYIPLDLSEEQRAGLIEKKYPYLLDIMRESGFSWTSADLAHGSKGNVTFNGKFARNKLIMNYLIDMWNDARSLGLPILELNNSRKIIRDFWERMWKGDSVPLLDFETQLFKDIQEEQELEVDNWVFNTKKSMEFVVKEVKNYFDSGIRAGTGKAKVMVISMRPDDIARMSTDRRWGSCLNLEGGSNRSSVYCEITRGGFAAYLIESDDLDIENPVARIWVRRFDSMDGKSFALPEETVYSDGRDFPEFLQALKEWVAEKQKSMPPGTYQMSGGEYSDTFEEEHEIENAEPLSPETIVEAITDPKIDEDSIQTIWKVRDEFYENWNVYFDDEEENTLTFFHLTHPKIFASEEKAIKWVTEHNSNAWRDEVIYSVLLYDDELRFETNDIYDDYDEDNLKKDNHNISELEGYTLTYEGLELARWSEWNSPFQRWRITPVSKKTRIKDKKTSIQARGLTWIITQIRSKDSELIRWMDEHPKKTIALKSYIQSDMSNDPVLRFSKQEAVRAIYKKFPSLFPEDRDKYRRPNGYEYQDELAHLLQHLEEGDEKEALKKEVLSNIENIYKSDKVFQAYNAHASYYNHNHSIALYINILKELGEDSEVGARLEKNLIDLYHRSLDNIVRKDLFTDHILRSLHAVVADSPEAIKLYKSLLQRIINADSAWQVRDSYSDSPSDITFNNIEFNLLQVGRAGEELLPLLATIYKQLRESTKEDVITKWLAESYQKMMNDIYRIIKSIRDDSPNRKKRDSDFSSMELRDELDLIL